MALGLKQDYADALATLAFDSEGGVPFQGWQVEKVGILEFKPLNKTGETEPGVAGKKKAPVKKEPPVVPEGQLFEASP